MQKKHILGAALVLALSACAKDPTYPGEWRSGGSAFDEIAIALGQNHTLGCGEFYYKLANGEKDPGEALVYCTRDGRNWDSYLVFYKIGNVMRVDKEPEWSPPVSSLGVQ
jgi:hypothetical protein